MFKIFEVFVLAVGLILPNLRTFILLSFILLNNGRLISSLNPWLRLIDKLVFYFINWMLLPQWFFLSMNLIIVYVIFILIIRLHRMNSFSINFIFLKFYFFLTYCWCRLIFLLTRLKIFTWSSNLLHCVWLRNHFENNKTIISLNYHIIIVIKSEISSHWRLFSSLIAWSNIAISSSFVIIFILYLISFKIFVLFCHLSGWLLFSIWGHWFTWNGYILFFIITVIVFLMKLLIMIIPKISAMLMVVLVLWIWSIFLITVSILRMFITIAINLSTFLMSFYVLFSDLLLVIFEFHSIFFFFRRFIRILRMLSLKVMTLILIVFNRIVLIFSVLMLNLTKKTTFIWWFFLLITLTNYSLMFWLIEWTVTLLIPFLWESCSNWYTKGFMLSITIRCKCIRHFTRLYRLFINFVNVLIFLTIIFVC